MKNWNQYNVGLSHVGREPKTDASKEITRDEFLARMDETITIAKNLRDVASGDKGVAIVGMKNHEFAEFVRAFRNAAATRNQINFTKAAKTADVKDKANTPA